MRRGKFRLMLAVFAAGYLVALWWVFTRSAPLVSARPVTIRFAPAFNAVDPATEAATALGEPNDLGET